MMTIYATLGSLKDIYLSGKETVGYKIITKQKKIFVDTPNDELEEHREKNAKEFSEESLFIGLETSYDIRIEYSDVISKVTSNPDELKKYPEGIFIIDVDPQKADTLREEYGVIVISQNQMDFSSLTIHDYYRCKKEENGNWGEVLKEIAKLPFNTLLINDRNLFTNEYTDNSSKKVVNSGITNVTEIIKTFLDKKPISSNSKNKDKIHIFIGFKYAENPKSSWTFKKIEDGLKQELQIFNSRYNILVELLAYKSLSTFWDYSHNRWFLTNNASITVEHKVHVFENGKTTVDQDINMNAFYSSGLDRNNANSWPISGHIDRLERLRAIQDDIKKNLNEYQYSSLFGGGDNKSDKIIKNRLL